MSASERKEIKGNNNLPAVKIFDIKSMLDKDDSEHKAKNFSSIRSRSDAYKLVHEFFNSLSNNITDRNLTYVEFIQFTQLLCNKSISTHSHFKKLKDLLGETKEALLIYVDTTVSIKQKDIEMIIAHPNHAIPLAKGLSAIEKFPHEKHKLKSLLIKAPHLAEQLGEFLPTIEMNGFTCSDEFYELIIEKWAKDIPEEEEKAFTNTILSLIVLFKKEKDVVNLIKHFTLKQLALLITENYFFYAYHQQPLRELMFDNPELAVRICVIWEIVAQNAKSSVSYDLIKTLVNLSDSKFNKICGELNSIMQNEYVDKTYFFKVYDPNKWNLEDIIDALKILNTLSLLHYEHKKYFIARLLDESISEKFIFTAKLYRLFELKIITKDTVDSFVNLFKRTKKMLPLIDLFLALHTKGIRDFTNFAKNFDSWNLDNLRPNAIDRVRNCQTLIDCKNIADIIFQSTTNLLSLALDVTNGTPQSPNSSPSLFQKVSKDVKEHKSEKAQFSLSVVPS